MDEIEALRRRTAIVRERFRALPVSAPDRQGPPDPKTGERWDRYNILGHVAEVLPFWVAQLEIAIDGQPFGRLPGSTERQQAVDLGREVGETALRERIDSGFVALERFLGALESSDLARKVTMRGRGEETVGWAMENLLVGHAEAHCDQLAVLG